MNNDRLFVYGSLLNNDNEFSKYLIHNADMVGPAFFAGRLYYCGEYPGAVLSDNAYPVKGSVYRLRNPNMAFTILDDYEGFGPNQEQPNLFIRESVSVNLENEVIECWAYLYNLPVDNLTEITTGDYISYLRQ